MIEPNRQFTTCFFSNIYVGGYRNLASITHTTTRSRRRRQRRAMMPATAIDRDKKEVVLGGGQRVAYDRLAVAPGIDIKFDSVPGYSEAAAEIMPHARKAGPQTASCWCAS